METKYDFESDAARKFPSMVQLTITNVCDMSCGHCPHSDYIKKPGFSPFYMDIGLYKKIADEVGRNTNTSLRIFGRGEPLMHPNLIEMISYAKNNGVEMTNLITNGLKLDEKTSEGLINSGLDLLEVSLDAGTRETYESVRGSAKNFDKVVSNVHRFLELRDELNGRTYVTLSIINQPKAIKEVEAFKEYWSKYADDTVMRIFHDFMGEAEDKEQITLPERHPCRCLWSRFNINSKGLVNICFNDWYDQSNLGDMKDPSTTIEKIWASKEYAEYRQSHLDNNPKGVCGPCNNWIGASWDFPYEILLNKAKSKIEERKKR